MAIAVPLSDAQLALWAFYRLAPHSPAYNMVYGAQLRADIDLAQLQDAYSRVVRSHEALHCGYCDGTGVALMVEPAQVLPDFSVERVFAWSEAQVRDWMSACCDEPFVLEQARVCRFRLLLNEAADGNRLYLNASMHHIAGDFLSFEMLCEQVFGVYEYLKDARPVQLPSPGLYRQWLAEQRAALDGETGLAWECFWRTQLQGETGALALTSDFARPRELRFDGEELEFRLGEGDTAGLKRLAQDTGVGLFSLLTALFQTLMHRWSGQDDFLVGTPMSGRSSRYKSLIGYTLNAVPLRARFEGDPGVLDVARAAQRQLRGALKHQQYPLARMTARFGGEGGVLFRHMLTLVPYGRREALYRHVLREFHATQRGAVNDLNLRWQDDGRRLLGQWRFNTALYRRDSIERLAQAMAELVTQVLRSPQARVGALSLNWPQVLSLRSGREGPVAEPTALQAFEAQVVRGAARPALLSHDRVVSYGELDRSAEALAGRLGQRAVQAGAIVGLLLPRSEPLIVGMLGAWKLGAAYLCLDPAWPAERLRHLLQDSRMAVVVGRGCTPSWLGDLTAWLDLDVADTTAPEPHPPLAPLLRRPDLPAYVIYTSGSTGTPKGVVVSQGALRHYAEGVMDVLALTPDASLTSLSSVAADLGYTAWFGALLSGRALRLIDDALAQDPEGLAQALARAPVDCLKIVPSHLKALLAVDDAQRLLPRQCLVLGGEGLDPAFVQRLRALRPDCRIVNHYGPTETTVGCVAQVVVEIAPTLSGFVPIGAPLPRTRVQVLDSRLNPLPPGSAGELAIGGAGVAAGYLRRPALTAERFVPEPSGAAGARMYRSGDRARMLADGTLEFLGRFDHQVKIRGYRVELGEIEAWLKAQPDLRDAAVLARPGPNDEALRLIGYLVAHPGLDVQRLRERMGGALPDHMLPAVFTVVERLPLTANGKLDRKALPEPQESDRALQRADTDAERRLLAIWKEVLQREALGVEDGFLESGGDSILALQIIARARAQGLRFTPKQVFELQTVRALARAAEAARPAGKERPVAPIVPVPRDRPLPLSFGQQRLWFLQQVDPQSSHYNVAGVLVLRGNLDVAALHSALRAIVQRHEVLRTRFELQDGQPVQCIDTVHELALPCVDLSSMQAELRQREAQRLSDADAARPFDLAAGPLLRLTLLKLGREEHVLLITMHHIVADGWSVNLLGRELAALYEAEHTGQGGALRPLAIQYADFAAWQRTSLAGAALDGQLAYWKQTLGTTHPVLELPFDRQRLAVPSHHGGHCAFSVDAELTARLRQLANSAGASLAMLMLAVFKVLLSRLSGQQDIRVGMPMAHRTHLETEGLIGFFVNTLVVRTQLHGLCPFDTVLQQVKEAMLGAQAHQDVPFERLVEALAPERQLSHTPLFQVLFNLQKPDFAALQRMGGLEVSVLARSNGTTQFDLILDIDDEGDTLQANMRYRSELWDDTTPLRWMGHYAELLRAVVRDPKQPVGLLPLMDDAEVAALQRGWNPAPRHCEVASSLHQVIEARADETPDAIALSLEGRSLSYVEMERRANRLAHRLMRHGVRPHMLVGLCAQRSVELVIGVLAILKAGGAYLPLDPDAPHERLLDVVRDAGATVVLSERPQPFDAHGLTVLDLHAPSGGPAQRPQVAIDPDALAYVIYTSGSTGRPKGVQVTHRNVLRLFEATREDFGFDASDVWTLFHSFTFDFSVWEIFGALLHGGRLVIVPYWVSRSPRDFHALLCCEGVTVLNQTPSAFRPLIQAEQESGAAPAHRLRYVIFGGEALDTASLRPWYARHDDARPRLVNMYGITETTVHVTLRPLTVADAASTGRSPIGAAISDLQVHLLDAQMNPVPPGVPGELHVGGDGLARGYLHRAALTAGRFVPDPFSSVPGARLYKSGDLARRLADGSLDYIGRIDQQVKLRGFRIELGEIEARLAEHPAVREVCLLVREDQPGDRQLTAYVVAGGEAPRAEVLRAHLARHLPEYMLPSAFVMLPTMPLTGNGKLDRQALPAPDRSQAPSDDTMPRTPLETSLALIWCELLGVECIGIHSNFFELGGHSLLATRVLARIRSDLGQELPIRVLFEAATIAQLAARLSDLPAVGEAVREEGPKPIPRTPHMLLSFAQQRLWLVDRLSNGSAAYNMAAGLRLTGMLDIDALRRSFALLLARHEVLRTAYPEADGEPVALIADSVDLDLPCIDLSALAPAEQAARIEAAQKDHAQRPFDLARVPLLRAAVLKLDSESHVLLIALHHIVADGWSVGILVNEFAAAYRALRGNQSPALPLLRLQVADHAAWQRARLSGERLQLALGFWTTQLRAAPSLLSLPLDFERPTVASHAGDVLRVTLPAALTAALERLGHDRGATLFMVLLAGYQALLHRLSSQDDLLIGTDVAGRSHRDLEDLIGFFVNVVPLRSRASSAADFGSLVEQAKQASLAAFEHQDLPFDRLVDALRLPRDRRFNPLVQVLFVLQNTPAGRFDIPGLQVEPLHAPQRASKFDLALFINPEGGDLVAEWVFASTLFKPDTVKRWAEGWVRGLERAAADPAAPLAAFTPEPPKDILMDPHLPEHRQRMQAKLDKLKQFTPGAKATPRPLVRTSFLQPGREFPVVLEPAAPDLDPIAWARTQRDFVESTLLRHAGILFRGFGLRTVPQFEAFAEAMHAGGLYGSYGDLPKKEGGRNTYRSTPYPEQQMILFHNESSHLERWPRKQWFFCELPAPVGGATPIVDCREMLRRMPAELVECFERKKLLYVRTFTDKLDVPWQEFFKTDDRAEVEARCRAAGTAWCWLPNGELQTRTLCPAVITHPVSGQRSFFNQIQLHHPACLEPEVRDDLLATVGADRLPRCVSYGDGSPIEEEVMALLGELYETCAVRFDWREGDVLMLDNMLAAHARDPYEGPRKVVVAMAEMTERGALAEGATSASDLARFKD